MDGRSNVVGFLSRFKSCVMLDFFHVRDRDKNIQGLIDLGINVSQRREILLGLETENYVEGPKPDDEDSSKEVWVFGKECGGIQIYIKMRVVEDKKRKDGYRALVWSFHPAEHTLSFPYRKGVE